VPDADRGAIGVALDPPKTVAGLDVEAFPFAGALAARRPALAQVSETRPALSPGRLSRIQAIACSSSSACQWLDLAR
jgi:hypothetical protein